MGFREQYKNIRLLKRSRRLKGRPLWQDQIPEEKPRKDTFRIAAKNQGKFSSAFRSAVKELLPDRMPLGFKAAYRRKSPVDVEGILFGVEFGGSEFSKRISRAYEDTVRESGEVATRELKEKFDVNMKFDIAINKFQPEVPVVPVNEYSVKWMRERSLTLIEELGDQQRRVIQGLLSDGFEKGLRAENVYADIKANIGLTGRESQAVVNRRALLEGEGMSEAQVDKQVDKYREQLLRKRAERIARTETIAADAAGRRHAWQLAEDTGTLPAVERVWISAPPSPNPDRPCEICTGLDGTTAPINGSYESAIVGPVNGPGPETHPS